MTEKKNNKTAAAKPVDKPNGKRTRGKGDPLDNFASYFKRTEVDLLEGFKRLADKDFALLEEVTAAANGVFEERRAARKAALEAELAKLAAYEQS